MESTGNMHIETLVTGPFQVNTLLLDHPAKDERLLVDPGADAEDLIARIHDSDKPLGACLLTHGHIDHIGAIEGILAVFDIPVYLHKDDAAWAFSEKNQIPPYYLPLSGRPEQVVEIGEQPTLCIGAWNINILFTPGHTPGGVCFLFPDERILLSGDTLFQGSVGRTDLPGGNSRILGESLKKLKALDDEIRVIPGHGPSTTIGMEKRTNYFMR